MTSTSFEVTLSDGSILTGEIDSARGADLIETLAQLHKNEINKKWILVGHSLSGNMALKVAGIPQHSSALKEHGCIGVVAVSPVVDLKTSSHNMHKPMFGLFDRVFRKRIGQHLKQVNNLDPQLLRAAAQAKKLAQFDENFLAPALALQKVDEYYNLASSQDVLHKIEIATEIFLATDDPIAPRTYQILAQVNNPNIRLHAYR